MTSSFSPSTEPAAGCLTSLDTTSRLDPNKEDETGDSTTTSCSRSVKAVASFSSSCIGLFWIISSRWISMIYCPCRIHLLGLLCRRRLLRLCCSRKKQRNNGVHTSKYTILSFIPKSLFDQFSRFSNIYFLSIGIMQLFPRISDSGGFPTTFMPLSIVIFVSCIKDLVEDLQRHRSDSEENNRQVKVCLNGNVTTKRWKDLHVGDIVKIEQNDPIPADLILLSSSGDFGVCYVETKNLDGETNLKHKMAIHQVALLFNSDKSASTLTVDVTCGPVADSLYEFHGTIDNIKRYMEPRRREPSRHELQLLKDEGMLDRTPPLPPIAAETSSNSPSIDMFSRLNACQSSDVRTPASDHYEKRLSRAESSIDNGVSSVLLKGPISVDMGQFILRGSSLVNTSWIYGLIVYVSKDTRLFQNANTQATSKWSHLERTYNRHVLVLVFCQVLCCLIICVGASFFPGNHFYLAWDRDYTTKNPFANTNRNHLMSLTHSPSVSFGDKIRFLLQVFGSMVILFAYFVPIDLLVMLEIVRFLQGCFVAWDRDIFSSKGDGASAISQSSHLLEELGNTTHVYTDKTGTLTQNIMVLRSLSVGPYAISSINDNSPPSIEGAGDETLPVQTATSPSPPVSEAVPSPTKIRLESSIDPDTPLLRTVSFNLESTNRSYHGTLSSGSRTIERDSLVSKKNPLLSDPIPLRLSNEFCSVELPQLERCLRLVNGPGNIDQTRLFLLSLGVCHTVLIHQYHDEKMNPREVNDSEDVYQQPGLYCYTEDDDTDAHLASLSSLCPRLPDFIIPIPLDIERQTITDPFWTIVSPPLAQYDASSPDELALVSAAQAFGVEFYQRKQLDKVQLRLLSQFARNIILGPELSSLWDNWTLHTNSLMSNKHCPSSSSSSATKRRIWVPIIEIDLLDVLEFDNNRKRMSVIIKDPIPIQENVWNSGGGSTQHKTKLIKRHDSDDDGSSGSNSNNTRISENETPPFALRLLVKGADTETKLRNIVNGNFPMCAPKIPMC